MVNSFAEQRSSIEDYVVTNMDTYETPVQFDNIGVFIKDGETLKDTDGLTCWARINILDEDSLHPTVGGKRTRFLGQLVVNIFVREKVGTNKAREIADELYDIFDGKSVNGIHFANVSLAPIGAIDGWYQLNLSAPFYWDRCKG